MADDFPRRHYEPLGYRALADSRRCLATAAVLAAISSLEASAADVRPYISGNGSYRSIVVEGNIQRGDFDTFVRIARENQGQISGVYCFSPGGDFYEAMKIGRAMRALGLHSQAPMRGPSGRAVCDDSQRPKDPKNCSCASAGFFMHIGAVHRGGTFLAVHRPHFAKGAFGELSEGQAEKAFTALQNSAREYMGEMGVPQHVQEEVLGTPSDKVLVLDEKTVKTYFWLDLPYRHEWLKNRCTRLSESERTRAQLYSDRLLASRGATDAGLSKEERADLKVLQSKKDAELQCGVAAERQMHVDAYEKYFHQKPSDFGTQNFAKWSEAVKYLGKSYYELMSEEKFQEDSFLEQTSLRRDATASAPEILLFDAESKPKVVASVALISTSNPSAEFIRRLSTTLEGAWGSKSGGNGTSEWRWDGRNFLAILKYEPKSANGPYLSLKIGQR
jgi:hypothetical protein